MLVRCQNLPRHAPGPQKTPTEAVTGMKWGAEAIWQAVVPLIPGFSIEILPAVDSTNSELMRRARAGQTDPVLLVAERQTAGRGRLGRSWTSEVEGVGASLTFSLGLPLAPASWSGLSLAVGVSVAQSLHPSLQLKWPNDIWLLNRKVGGILIETASTGAQRYVVVGVGLNIMPREWAGVGAGLSTPPACVQDVQPGMDAAMALQRLVEPLVRTVQQFEQHGFAPFQAAFARLDLLAGRDVTLSGGGTAHALGVDEQGGLRVRGPDGLQTISSSEVSVRPIS